MTAISSSNMARLREVEAELDQQDALLRLAETELERTDVAQEFAQLRRLVAQASQQAIAVTGLVEERML